jgi:uncharacterized membrane protein
MLILLFILIFLGLLNSLFLGWQHWQYKKNNRPMVCPISGQCAAVVESKYASTLGFNNDLLGTLFYLFFAAMLLAGWILPEFGVMLKNLALLTIGGAFVFTNYLLVIQAFVLKKWCFWCIIAALINYLLFISSLIYFL